MFCNGIGILFFRFSDFFPSSFSQNFHVRFFEEQKRPSGPPKRALSSPHNSFFLPHAIAEASRSVPAFSRTPSERFSLSDGMLFPRVRSSFPRSPSLLRPFSPFLSPPFSHAPAPLVVFFRELPLFFPRVLIPLASIFTLFKTLFPSLFPPCASFRPFLPLRLFPFHFLFRFFLHFLFRFLPDFPRFFYSSQPCPILTAFILWGEALP